MRFKKGDKVEIKEYRERFINFQLKPYCGKTLTIKGCYFFGNSEPFYSVEECKYLIFERYIK